MKTHINRQKLIETKLSEPELIETDEDTPIRKEKRTIILKQINKNQIKIICKPIGNNRNRLKQIESNRKRRNIQNHLKANRNRQKQIKTHGKRK